MLLILTLFACFSSPWRLERLPDPKFKVTSLLLLDGERMLVGGHTGYSDGSGALYVRYARERYKRVWTAPTSRDVVDFKRQGGTVWMLVALAPRAGASGQEYRLLRSGDEGETWAHVSVLLPGRCWRLELSAAGDLWVRCNRSLLHSEDSGSTWQAVAVPIRDRRVYLQAMTVHGETVFVSTHESVQSTVDGVVWDSEPDDVYITWAGEGEFGGMRSKKAVYRRRGEREWTPVHPRVSKVLDVHIDGPVRWALMEHHRGLRVDRMVSRDSGKTWTFEGSRAVSTLSPTWDIDAKGRAATADLYTRGVLWFSDADPS